MEAKHQDHITRKICRVTSKGARLEPGTGKVMELSLKRSSLSLTSPGACHLKPASYRKKEHAAYIYAWKDAQKLVKEVLVSRSISASGCKKDNTMDHKTKHEQMTQQQSAASNIQNWQRSNMTLNERSRNPSKCPSSSQASVAPSGGFGKSLEEWPTPSEGDENESPSTQKEVRKHTHQQAVRRKAKEQKRSKTAELGEQRKRKMVQEVVRKQKAALRRSTKQHRLESETTENAERKNGHVVLEREPVANVVHGQPQQKPESQISLVEAQRGRDGAVGRSVAFLDARLENEAVRLRPVERTDVGCTGDGPNHGESRNGARETMSAVGYLAKQKQLDTHLVHWTPAMACRKQSEWNTVQRIPEDQDDSSRNTDSTRKWSDPSEVSGQSRLPFHLSVVLDQHLLREEELRARQHSALYRLREEALWERTLTELAWLDSCKKHVILEEDVVAELKQKKDDILCRLRQEQAELDRWHRVSKRGKRQPWLLFCHERNILDIRGSATHFSPAQQSPSMARANVRPRDPDPVQEGRRFSMRPGIIPDARSREKPAGGQERFLSKAGLRRLLTSDEVWSFGRKKSHPIQPCHHTIPERNMKKEEEESLHQLEASQADSKPNGYECEIKKIQSPLLKRQHNHLCQSKSSEVCLEQDIQNPAEAPWKSIRRVQQFTVGQHGQPGHGASDRVPITSSLSSDIEEDLPYDCEDSHETAGEQSDAKFQEMPKIYSASDDMILGCDQAITDYVTLNLQNNQRLQTVLLLNNNHEICDESRKTYTAYAQGCHNDSDTHISGPQMWQSTKESMMDKPFVATLGQALSGDVKQVEESPFCDDSFSETEDKSEPFSLQSDALAWSEEERDVLSEEKTEGAMGSLIYAEKFIVVPQLCMYDNKHYEVGLHESLYCKREMIADSTLSEILSPVDEVLSYGSADLPPSVRAGGGIGQSSNSLPPPSPAFEIITWTSEEDLPVPPDFVEDISVNSENVPPLPVDPSLCRRKARSLGENEVNNDDGVIGHECKALDPLLATGQDEDEGSEYINSLPVDEHNEIQDPLSSYCIGDRVLVYKSRPGVLKYKGHPAFASGFWAGVALDTPTGNHNGTFKGVKYFTCEKNCGVLVRAEDISQSRSEYCSDVGTGVDEETFSDEDPQNEDSEKGQGDGEVKERHWNDRSCPGHVSLAPKQTFQQEPYENAARITPSELSKCSRSIEKSPVKVDHELMWHNGNARLYADVSGAQTEGLTEEISLLTVKNVQETRKRHRQRTVSKHDSKAVDADFRKREDSNFTANIPCIMDEWYQAYPETPPQIHVNTHEPRIVYSLVDATVEVVCAREMEGALDGCETPSYLADDDSHKSYRQVVFQLASDILHDVCADILETNDSAQNTKVKSVMSAVQREQISVSFLKAAVKRESQKLLNLEHTDQEMTEMLKTLCKYWYAKRDRVDYILIQELHSEERQWVDYSADQITVKIRLSEEIFRLLLDDTISVLNHIYISDNKR